MKVLLMEGILLVAVSVFTVAQTPEQPKVVSSTCVSGCAQPEHQQHQDLTGPLITFDPGHQQPLTYEDKSVQVILVIGQREGSGYTPDWHALSLKIKNRLLNETRNIPLPDEIAQVSEIRHVIGNKFVVLGLISSSASEAAVVDLVSGAIIDKFYADFPSISPDGHYIAFMKWTPVHTSPDLNVEDHYLLYDLTKDARQNRPKEVSSSDLETVGTCFYPAGIGNSPGDNLRATPGNEHLSRSLLFWSPESRQLIFANQVNSDRVLNVVLASIHSESTVGITSIEQSVEDICTTRDGQKIMCPVLMRKATFVGGDDPRIDAVFELVQVQLLRTRSYPISEFR